MKRIIDHGYNRGVTRYDTWVYAIAGKRFRAVRTKHDDDPDVSAFNVDWWDGQNMRWTRVIEDAPVVMEKESNAVIDGHLKSFAEIITLIVDGVE